MKILNDNDFMSFYEKTNFLKNCDFSNWKLFGICYLPFVIFISSFSGLGINYSLVIPVNLWQKKRSIIGIS